MHGAGLVSAMSATFPTSSFLAQTLGIGRYVWDRPAGDLKIAIEDPVGRGLLREGITTARIQARPNLLVLRPALGRDHYRIDQARRLNQHWLSPWEATIPPGSDEKLPDFRQYCRETDRRQRMGQMLVMVIELDKEVVGTVTLSGVQRGSLSQGMVGYWVTCDVAHRGVGSLGVAIVLDLVIKELGLHRLEICVRPENDRSLGLCRKLGLREEGLRPRFMNIGGRWADHLAFAIDAESMPECGLVHQIWGADVF